MEMFTKGIKSEKQVNDKKLSSYFINECNSLIILYFINEFFENELI